MNINTIIHKAKSSSFYLKLLNIGLNWMIPFNKPHGFKILKITDTSIKTFLPYKKKNLNHIKGLHACALATLSEFTTGVLLITKLDPKKYRIILKSLYIDYQFQGKMGATAEFSISDSWLEENIYTPIANSEAVLLKCDVNIMDEQGNVLTNGVVTWQIKSWQKVKTKL